MVGIITARQGPKVLADDHRVGPGAAAPAADAKAEGGRGRLPYRWTAEAEPTARKTPPPTPGS